MAAYEHRDSMTERLRLQVIADYNEEVSGDIDKTIEAYKQEIALFPQSGNRKGSR